MRFNVSSLLWILPTAVVEGFTAQTRIATHGSSIANPTTTSSLWSSAPSDSASDEPDFAEFGYGSSSSSALTEEEVSASVSEALVNKVLKTLPSDFSEVSTTTQASINEILFTLEALNPTKSPALSPMVNGVWELRYSGGYTDDVRTKCTD